MGNKVRTNANRTTKTETKAVDLIAMAEATKVASEAIMVALDSKGKTFARKAEESELELIWRALPMEGIPPIATESASAMQAALKAAAKAAKLEITTRKDGFAVWGAKDRLWRLVGGRIKVTKAALASQGAGLEITGLEVSLANFVKFAKTKLVPVS